MPPSEELERRRAAFKQYQAKARALDAEEMASKPLAERLRSKRHGVRFRSLKEAAALGATGQELLAETLAAVPDPGYRFQILPLLNERSAASTILRLLADERVTADRNVVCAALSALGRCLGSESGRHVAPYLFDKRHDVRSWAALTISKHGSVDVRDQVLAHWRRTLPAVLRQGERALAEAESILLYWARLALEAGPETVVDVVADIQQKLWPRYAKFLNPGGDALQGAPYLIVYILSYWPELLSGSPDKPGSIAPSAESVMAWPRV